MSFWITGQHVSSLRPLGDWKILVCCGGREANPSATASRYIKLKKPNCCTKLLRQSAPHILSFWIISDIPIRVKKPDCKSQYKTARVNVYPHYPWASSWVYVSHWHPQHDCWSCSTHPRLVRISEWTSLSSGFGFVRSMGLIITMTLEISPPSQRPAHIKMTKIITRSSNSSPILSMMSYTIQRFYFVFVEWILLFQQRKKADNALLKFYIKRRNVVRSTCWLGGIQQVFIFNLLAFSCLYLLVHGRRAFGPMLANSIDICTQANTDCCNTLDARLILTMGFWALQ